jgi:hypothetical protein
MNGAEESMEVDSESHQSECNIFVVNLELEAWLGPIFFYNRK